MTWLLLGTHRAHSAPPATSAHARTVMGDSLCVSRKPGARELGLGAGWERKGRELTAPTASEVYLTSHMAGHPLSADCEGTFLVPHSIRFPDSPLPRHRDRDSEGLEAGSVSDGREVACTSSCQPQSPLPSRATTHFKPSKVMLPTNAAFWGMFPPTCYSSRCVHLGSHSPPNNLRPGLLKALRSESKTSAV